MYDISRMAGAAALAGLAAASISAIERARADSAFRSRSPEAVRLAPDNTEYLMFRALQIEYDGGDPGPLWKRAAELNPLNSAPRIALGLDAEVRGDFEPGANGHGFDWRLSTPSGVTHTDIDQPRLMHRIDFDGREPESCELLRQTLLLEKGRRYRLRWNASSSGIPPPGGIEWRIAGVRAPASGPGELEFTAPAEIADLKLIYQRPPGQPRPEGRLELWGVRLEPRI